MYCQILSQRAKTQKQNHLSSQMWEHISGHHKCSVSHHSFLCTIFALQIEQDFRLLFGEATANKFLEKWPTNLKTKVITESRGLVPTTELLDLMRNAESTAVVENGMTGGCF